MTLRSTLALAVLALALAVALPVAAADPPGLAEGRAAFDAKDFGTAATAFEKAVAADPANAEAWYRLGIARRELKQYDGAVDALQKALEKGYPPPAVTAGLAIVYSLTGDLDRSFQKLNEAAELGVPASAIKDHPGLAAARADARFKPMIELMERRAHPCENDPRYAAFDFWVGDWDVYSPTGQKLGENRIEKVLRGCAVAESWTDASGTHGRSMNYFDPTAGKWRQNWVDEGGVIVWYEGEVKDGAMHFSGENKTPTGTVTQSRVTLTPRPDGSVHHVIEISRDGGKTWSKGFDGLYVKKGQAPPAGGS